MKVILKKITLTSLFLLLFLAIPTTSASAVGIGVEFQHRNAGGFNYTGSFDHVDSTVDSNDNIYTIDNLSGSSNADYGDGELVSTPPNSSVLRAMDSEGNYRWHHLLEGTDIEGYDVETDSNNNVYWAGRFTGTNVDFGPLEFTEEHTSTGSGYDGFISKLSSNGSHIWTKIFSSQIVGVYDISIDNNDNLYLHINHRGGNLFLNPNDQENADEEYTGSDPASFLVKLDSDGNYLNDNLVYISETSTGSAATVEELGGGIEYANGKVYMYGMFDGQVSFDSVGGTENITSDAGGDDLYISVFNSDLSYDQTHIITADSTYTEFNDIAVDTSGNIYALPYFIVNTGDIVVGGATISKYPDGGEISPLFKLNSNGNLVWERAVEDITDTTFEGTYGYDVEIDNNRNIVVFNNVYSTDTPRDMNLNPNGSDIKNIDGYTMVMTVYEPDGTYLDSHVLSSSGIITTFSGVIQSDGDYVLGYDSRVSLVTDENLDTVITQVGAGVLIYDTTLLLQELNLYRFFNTDTGTHFYTASTSERDKIINTLPQFQYERDVYKIFDEDGEETVPVYRFFNTDTGAHFYTRSVSERDKIMNTLPQFQYEGAKFYVYSTAAGDRKAVYRFFNTDTGTHFYTSSTSERDKVINTLPQFIYERIEYYVPN